MHIAVMSAGWLGKPLALTLQNEQHQILATARREDAIQTLAQQNITALSFQLGQPLSNQLLEALQSVQVIVLNIPAGRKSTQHAEYLRAMKQFISQLVFIAQIRIIFISSTSVYGEQSGVIRETTPCQPETGSAKANFAVENMLKDQFPQRFSILRLAGLVGEDRHPARFLAGRTLDNGSHPVNLVHRQDVIQAIKQIISGKGWGKTMHLSTSEHPSRADYYTYACNALDLATPTFSEINDGVGRIIEPFDTLNQLGLTLKFVSPYQMITNSPS